MNIHINSREPNLAMRSAKFKDPTKTYRIGHITLTLRNAMNANTESLGCETSILVHSMNQSKKCAKSENMQQK